MGAEALLAAFVEAWPGHLDDAAREDVAAGLVRIVDQARASFSAIDVPPDAFVQWLATRMPTTSIVEALGGTLARAGDLWLAHACARGHAAALSAFDRRMLAGCGAYVRRVEPSPEFAEEVAQIVREKLLVGVPGKPARIAEYAGRGSLASWVRVVVMRVALNLRRARTVSLATTEAELDAAVEGDPALAFARENYTKPFHAAVRAAIAALTAQERTVLRLYYVDRLGIDRIGAIYKVHRSTAARWLVDTREALHDTIRSELRRDIGVTGLECKSIANALYSRLTLSLGSLLRSPAP